MPVHLSDLRVIKWIDLEARVQTFDTAVIVMMAQ